MGVCASYASSIRVWYSRGYWQLAQLARWGGHEMSQNNNGGLLMFSTGMVPQMGIQWDRTRMCVAVIIAIAGPRFF